MIIKMWRMEKLPTLLLVDECSAYKQEVEQTHVKAHFTQGVFVSPPPHWMITPVIIFINPWRVCAARVLWLDCLVGLSVSQHLTSGASVRLENTVTHSAGNEGQNICGVFSETTPLQRSSTSHILPGRPGYENTLLCFMFTP